MKYYFLLISALSAQLFSAQYKYPATPERPVVDDYFGTKITDNYRWLEDNQTPEVQSWFKAQADFSSAVINRIPSRSVLFKKMKEIQQMGGDSYGGITRNGKTYFYTKVIKNAKLSKLYSQDASTGKESLLFDPETLGKNTQITSFTVDPTGKKMAILFSKSGAEICELRILDLTTNKMFDDVVGPIWSEFGFDFTPDGKSLIYTKMSTGDPNSPNLLKDMKAMLHQVGTATDKDIILASREQYPELNILPEQFCSISFTDDYKHVVLRVTSTQWENPVYYAPLSSIKDKKISWKPIMKASDEITDYYITDNKLFFVTHKNAPNYKLGVTDLNNPDFNNSKIIVPESDKVITGIHSSKNYLFYGLSDGISQNKYQISLADPSVIKRLPLPDGVNSSGSLNARESDDILCYNFGWLTPYSIYEYNPASGTATKSKKFDVGGSYPDYKKLYEIKEVEVKSHDGVMVPLSIIYPKNMKMDGSSPAYITGYGGYSTSYKPFFSSVLTSLLEQGVVIAIAHVRGGGEKGESWHQSGMKSTKPNTWKDFIACSEYLVNQKYTSPSRLIGNGASMGGVLIGRAITERPDLYEVAIVEVGMTNTLRVELTANGPNQIPEIGTLKNEEDTKNLLEMDAQSKVKKGVNYPAVLVRTGINDSRIVPWMPAKFAAILQKSTASDKPVLLSVNYENGHFTGDLDVTFQEYADMFSFALWQVGHPNFQPSKK